MKTKAGGTRKKVRTKKQKEVGAAREGREQKEGLKIKTRINQTHKHTGKKRENSGRTSRRRGNVKKIWPGLGFDQKKTGRSTPIHTAIKRRPWKGKKERPDRVKPVHGGGEKRGVSKKKPLWVERKESIFEGDGEDPQPPEGGKRITSNLGPGKKVITVVQAR